MSESNHTPGPWQVSGGRSRQDTYGHTIGPDGLGIACVFYSDRTNADHLASLADARLIAQAWKIPDLEAQIASLTADKERLREALEGILPYTATQSVGCHGEKCRESWCHSCNSEDDANSAAMAGAKAYRLALATLQSKDDK